MKKHLQVLLAIFMIIIFAAGCGSNASETAARTESATRSESETDGVQAREGVRVSYLGPAGTYTEEATRLFFPNSKSLVPKETVDDAIAELKAGNADYAVIPQENTIGGVVTDYADALIGQKDVYVAGEVILPISQTLMGVPGAKLDDIRIVCSHAQGLAQSEQWRKENLPDATIQEMESTAAAASYVAETGDKSIAAVAAPGAADLYGLSVLARDVQISDANKTRFYVLSSSEATGKKRTRAAFIASCGGDRIDDIIVAIHDAGLETVAIHDRPEGSRLGSYNYIIEVESGKGISEKAIEKICAFPEIRYIGSFNTVEGE